MTGTDSATHWRIGERHAPELVCDGCDQTIPRDVASMFGRSVEVTLDRRPGRVCEPCWDAAEPDAEDPTWRRCDDGQALRIGAGPRPYVLRQDCEHCGRPVLLDVSRRRLASCSKRCQVYASQARWPKARRERPARVCRCGAEFTSRRREHRFCSHVCRQAAYRAQRARRARSIPVQLI